MDKYRVLLSLYFRPYLRQAGLETLIGPRGTKLSGGQAQRTAAARMFVRKAQLLVFDDLSSALDVETEQALWARLFEQPPAACLVVSHRRAALRRNGRAVEGICLNFWDVTGDVTACNNPKIHLSRNPEKTRSTYSVAVQP